MHGDDCIGTSVVANWQQGNNNQIAFSRKGSSFIALNRGSSTWNAQSLQTGLPSGIYCNIIASDDKAACSTVSVNSQGLTNVSVPPLSAVAFHINCKI
jgi:alpha-amylase